MHFSPSLRSFFLTTPLLVMLSSCGQEAADPSLLADLAEANPDNESDEDHYHLDPNEVLDSAAAIKQTPAEWNSAILSNVREQMPRLEKAHDKNNFCPGYESATDSQKESCWVRIVKATIRYESTFDAKLTFEEPNGDMSVGLLMLSPGECAEAKTAAQLKNPVKNINCGMAKMARLISRDNAIAGTGTKKGAAAYWSVLRRPYKYAKYKLGKQNEIIALTKGYKVAVN
jgi:hypothetical protein